MSCEFPLVATLATLRARVVIIPKSDVFQITAGGIVSAIRMLTTERQICGDFPAGRRHV
jgi:hypothetical protein